MIDIKHSVGRGFGTGGLYDILKELQLFSAGIKGEVYFVENNAGDDGNDGLSWDKAKKTLAAAITASNANIAAGSSGWAARNTIFIKGDAICEDLTVFPAKCDVIGAGSCDAINKTRIIGEHTETGDGVIQSTGWYNIEFKNDDASAIFTVTTYSGLYFGDCIFTADADAVNAILTSGSCDNFTIKNCWFRNDEDGNDPFATCAISIAGAAYNMVIKNSFVQGDVGIKFANATTYNCRVDNCTIVATTLCLDDDSSLVVFTNNNFITAANGTTPNDVVDANVKFGANNVLTDGTVGTISYPTLSDLTTA